MGKFVAIFGGIVATPDGPRSSRKKRPRRKNPRKKRRPNRLSNQPEKESSEALKARARTG